MAVLGGLHRVVVVLGEHATLEGADNLGTIADSADIWNGPSGDAGHARLADIRKARAALGCPDLYHLA